LAAGAATSIYMITKAIFQIPCGKFISKIGEKKVLLIGNGLIVMVFLGYYLMTSTTHLYLINALYGFGAALAFPSWYAVFSRNISKGKEAYEWSVYEFFTNTGPGIAAFVGGIIAQIIGFKNLFLGCFFISGAGYVLLFTSFNRKDFATAFEMRRVPVGANVKNVVGALIFNNRGKLLVVKERKNYALPGGEVRSGLDSQALIDNIQNDLENNVGIRDTIFFKEYDIKTKKENLNLKTYICTLKEPYFLPKKAVWISRREVPKLHFSRVLRKIMPDLIDSNLIL